MSKTVSIIYGGAEGSRTGLRLKNALLEAGYVYERNPAKADVIIAHSAGCYLVPNNIQASTTLLVGIPHWPGKSIFKGVRQKFAHDIRYCLSNRYRRWFLYKSFWNTIYFLRFDKAVRTLKGRSQGRLWELRGKVIVVRNDDDFFCMPEFEKLPFKSTPQYVTIEGTHDDLWINPAVYISLLN